MYIEQFVERIYYAVYAKGGITQYAEHDNEVFIPLFLLNKFLFDKGGTVERTKIPFMTVFS